MQIIEIIQVMQVMLVMLEMLEMQVSQLMQVAHLRVDFRVICLGSLVPFSQEIDIGNVECSA